MLPEQPATWSGYFHQGIDYFDRAPYFPWYDATGTGVIHSNNVDTGTGGPCNCNTISGDGSCD
jgi:hypothetical protein